jgi:hypothetical protein
VQSFILGAPIPYENEPGYDGRGNTPAAIKNTKQIQTKVVVAAMSPWLNKIIDKTPHIWSEIAHEYWKHHGEEIIDNVTRLEKTNASLKPHRLLLGALFERAFETVKNGGDGGQESSSRKRKRVKEDDATVSLTAWVYGGEWTMKMIREACGEIGVQPARSMQQSVDRLEAMVNDNDLGSTEFGKKWGN